MASCDIAWHHSNMYYRETLITCEANGMIQACLRVHSVTPPSPFQFCCVLKRFSFRSGCFEMLISSITLMCRVQIKVCKNKCRPSHHPYLKCGSVYDFHNLSVYPINIYMYIYWTVCLFYYFPDISTYVIAHEKTRNYIYMYLTWGFDMLGMI